jgi:hypothetical protein
MSEIDAGDLDQICICGAPDLSQISLESGKRRSQNECREGFLKETIRVGQGEQFRGINPQTLAACA